MSQEEEAESKKPYEEKLKLMVIGEARVGKTSIIKRYTDNFLSGEYLSTIGIDYQDKIIKIGEKLVKLEIWDTAGQERFKIIAKNYFQNSDGFLLVYDISIRDSFERLTFWHEQIKLNAPINCRFLVVGNKCDLEKKRQVSKEEGEKYAENYNVKFYETSAKDDININEIFQTLASETLEIIKKKGQRRNFSSLVLKKNNLKKKKKKFC